MKRSMILLLLVASVNFSYAQKATLCDPLLRNLNFSNSSDERLDLNMLETGIPVKMRFELANGDAVNEIPAGTCIIVVALGKGLRPATDVSGLPMDRYFDWSIQVTEAGHMLNAQLKRNLPAGFSATLSIDLLAANEGASTVSCQVLVSNNKNNGLLLADVQPGNNAVYSNYRSIKGLAVKFTDLHLSPRSCGLQLDWATKEEAEIKNYSVETSNDGINFSFVRSMANTNAGSYALSLEDLFSRAIWVRIKAEDATGRFVYSDTKSATVICKTQLEAAVFPNPVSSRTTEVTIQAQKGVFNGKYNVTLLDAWGKELKKGEQNSSYQSQFKYNTGFLTGGTYYIKLTNEEGEVLSLKLVKQ